MIKDKDGGYVLLGEATNEGGFNWYSQLIKITGSGQIQWGRIFKANAVSESDQYSVLHSGFQTSDGGFILTGVTDADIAGDVSQSSNGYTYQGFWVVKTTRQIQPGEILMSSGSTGVSPSNTYYDPGFVANYGNNLDVTQNLSARYGYKLRLTFTSFQLENTFYDRLYIYDGASTAAPLIGVYSGSNSPGVVTSSIGSLTLRFISDLSKTYQGWVAAISYVGTGARLAAAAEEAQETLVEQLEAFPNPFTDKLTLRFTCRQTGPVSVKIYDSKGLLTADVFAGEVQARESKSVE